MGFLFNHNTGKALNSANSNGAILSYITTSNVYWDRFELKNLKTMPFTDSEIDKCTVLKGDLLVCEGGDIGRAAIWNFDEKVRIQNHIHRLRAYDDVQARFFYYVIFLYKMNGKINGNGIGLQGLSSNILHNILVPVPPIKEQKNIVSAIYNLMSIIENIESSKTTLMSHIDCFKSKILDLAIRGKLVPQDPNDEPASVLLERIRAEKEELIKQGKIKRDKKESIIFKGDDNSYYEKVGNTVTCIDDEIPFEIPENWCYSRLSDLSYVTMGSSPQSKDICTDDQFVEFHQGKIYFSNKILNNSTQYTKTVTKTAPEHSVLLCIRAPVGEVNITDRKICIGRGLASIKPLCNMSAEFMFYWLQTYKSFLISQSTGSTFSAITSDTVKNMIIPIPPLKEQRNIVIKIDKVFALIENISTFT